MTVHRLTPLDVIGSCDIALDTTLWNRLCAQAGTPLIAALERATPPEAIRTQLYQAAANNALARHELVAAWPHFTTDQRVALIATLDGVSMRAIAGQAASVAELDAIFDAAPDHRVIENLLAAEDLAADARTRAVERLVTDTVTLGLTRYDELLTALLTGTGSQRFTRAAVRAALPAPDAHNLLWWRYAETTDEDRERIIDAAVTVAGEDDLYDTATWAHRLGPATFERFCAAITAATQHRPRPELAAATERIAQLTTPDNQLNTLAEAYLADGDPDPLTAALTDRSRSQSLHREVADQVIADPRTDTTLALLAAQRSRNAGLEAPALFTLRPDDVEFHVRLAARAPGDAVVAALTASGQLADVAVAVLDLWTQDNHTVHASTWVEWVGHTGDRLREVSWPAVHAAAVHSDTARALLGAVYRRAPLLALELADGFAGTVAEFDALLIAVQRDGQVVSTHVSPSRTHSTV